jgi:2-polyprenyl-3-methyl-5-hydroxy-6-metoxy-1,4-benzoquinol methylase
MDKQVYYTLQKILREHNTEAEGVRRYDKHTIQSSNIFARYAHRNRIMRCINYVLPRLETGKILDYGCGTGVFISLLNRIKPNSAIGYEPFMKEKYTMNTIIYTDYNMILAPTPPINTITIFEVIEHLGCKALNEFLIRADELLYKNSGVIFVSVPIEIGPVLIIKEIYRVLRTKKIEYNFFEFLKAAFLGIPGERIGNDRDGYGSHKGFDFRKILKYFELNGWNITILGYGPLPIKTWYGNSQVFFKAEKKNNK